MVFLLSESFRIESIQIIYSISFLAKGTIGMEFLKLLNLRVFYSSRVRRTGRTNNSVLTEYFLSQSKILTESFGKW